MNSAEYRNVKRRELRGTFEVIDCMTDLRIGHLLDLSASGFQVATTAPLVQDALYQWRFPLPASGGLPAIEIECGIQILWVNADSPGEHTAGARFIQISPQARERILAWSEDN